MSAPAILVTDGHLRPSLAVVRSLGAAGFRVFVASPRHRSLAGASRFAVAHARTPDPLATPDAFAEAIVDLVRKWSISVLFPMSEEAMLAVMPLADRMPGVVIPFAPLQAFKLASDKRHVAQVAATIGIAVPQQVVVGDRSAATDSDYAGRLDFPIVVKPSRSVGDEPSNRQKMGVAYAHDPAEVQEALASLPASAFPVLLQERITGPGTGVFLLMWDGEVIAHFAHRRIREKPPTGGVSVLSESVAADPDAVRRSVELLRLLDWRGPAMVEYKQDERTGKLYLMEINGRFWGSLQLAIDAGVDFPALLARLALGERLTPVARYDVGVRCRWWWGEVDHLLARFKGRRDPSMPGSFARAVRDFLLSGLRVRNEVLRRNDPWPFAQETFDWFRGR